uniref:Uncharacterized protein n=1 Tax=Tanacetum cinerariifolium TaxID=118510 RepID=A0A6L2KVF2_TANCI|nr:hypothetical protein [Tanacetum cinerariifolium]
MRVEDLQLGVESYQKKLNLTKPDTYRSNLRNKTAYTSYSDPHGIICVDQFSRKRLMRADELHKFSNGTLNDVWSDLHDIAARIRIEYMPIRKWSNLDKKRARVMVQDIDKQLYQRRLMRNLEKFVGGREYGNDLRLNQRDLPKDIQLDSVEVLSWVNERNIQTTEEKVDTSKPLDASSVDTEYSRIESKEQDTRSRSGNDAHDDDVDIRPIYDEETMATVQTTAEINVFAIGQQHTKQPEFNNEGEVVQNAEECHDIWKHSQFLKEKSNEAKAKHAIDVIETIIIELEHKVAKLLKENETLKKNYKELFDSIKKTRAKTIEHTTSLIATNDKFKTQLQEKGFAIASLKNELRKSTGNSVNTKFAKSSILRKPMSQPLRNQSVVRQPTVFKSERPRLSKPWISSKNMPRFTSNDMVHNHYLEKAKKKTQKHSRNSEPSLMPSARSKSTTNGSKPMPRRNSQTSRNWPASKNSFVTIKTVPIAEHSRNSRNFFDSKHFVCSTCQKCVFSANQNSCVTKFLKEVNSHAKVPSNKTTNRNKLVEQISVPNKQERQILTWHRFSIQKTSVVQKKTMTPRSCLRWKPTGKNFKTVGLRWVPTGKIFASNIPKVDSEPLMVQMQISLIKMNANKILMSVQFKAGSKRCSSIRQDIYIATSVAITIPPSHNNAESHSSRVRFNNPCSCSNYKDILSIRIQESRKLKHKDKVFPNSDLQDLPSRNQVYQGRLLASFQDDTKYEHGGQDTRLQGGKRQSRQKDKDLKMSDEKTKSKDSYKRLKIKDHKA